MKALNRRTFVSLVAMAVGSAALPKNKPTPLDFAKRFYLHEGTSDPYFGATRIVTVHLPAGEYRPAELEQITKDAKRYVRDTGGGLVALKGTGAETKIFV